MKSVQLVLLTCLIWGASFSATAAVTASLDRNQIAPGETVRLLLQHDGSADSQPDIRPLRPDFDVLGTSSGSSMQIINGHSSSQTQMTLTLAPKHDGKIVIPPLQWDNQQSAALELTVASASGKQGAASSADTSHVFLTATPDQKQPYVQAAIVLTVRLYADEPIYQASLSLPAGDDVLVKQLGEDRQTTELRNGRSYQVVERKYLLFPQRSGKLSIDGPVLDAQVPDTGSNDPFGSDPFFSNAFGRLPIAGMMNATRPVHLSAKRIELNVLPRPASATGPNWLPAQSVTLEEAWRPDAQTLHVGEPITRHLHLAALALTGAQLPDMSTLMSVPDGMKTYPDQAKIADAPQGSTVMGSRDQDIALIAQRPGHYVLPAVKLSWWDTVHNAPREVMLPAHSLDILAAAAGSAEPAPSPQAMPLQSIRPDANVPASAKPVQPARPAGLWQWVSLALALLWLATILVWWYSRRRVQPPAVPAASGVESANVNAGHAFRAFRQACLENDAPAARRHLIAWAGSVWPIEPPTGLHALSRRLSDDKLTDALMQLDRACYTEDAWQGATLAALLTAMPVEMPAHVQSKPRLPDLYS
jgi:hypothetical protein